MADAVDHANNPSKFFTHFLYKATLITIFLVLLPLFPSLAPEFINQTLHARSWELLQLIFVGIAVSYGLFSKKNDETDKDHHQGSKIDNAQSYVSKLLQVSSVFDDESEALQNVIDENNGNNSKVQTWSSQYYREEPVVVVAKESPVVKEDKNGSSDGVSEITQKPLLLPVRSLKQRVISDPNEVDSADDSGGVNRSKRVGSNSRKSRNGELGVLNVEKKFEENVVLRSPIPWRSRSGRMEMKENGADPNPGPSPSPSFLVSPPMEEQEVSRVVASRSFRSSNRHKTSPHKLSPSTSFSSESQSRSGFEDVVRKKSFSTSPPAPPPPPPLPPRFLQKPVLTKSNSTIMNNARPTSERVLRRSARSAPTEEELMDEGGMMNLRGRSVGTFGSSSGSVQSADYGATKFFEKNVPDEEEEDELVEKVLMENTSDDEDDDHNDELEMEEVRFEESRGNEEAKNDVDTDSVNDVGPDVDKKADEFIAKFREQIRLQRIESIRRTTAQRPGRSFR